MIIGLSGKAQHGKDTTCDIIKQELWKKNVEVVRIAFADGVKEEARAKGWDGDKNDTGRTMLQEIGSIRRAEDPLYWVKAAFDKIDLSDNKVYVITDVRYRNEAEFISNSGGDVWRIERTTDDGGEFDNGLTPEQKAHPSETDLDQWPGFMFVLNASNVHQLRDKATQALVFYRFDTKAA